MHSERSPPVLPPPVPRQRHSLRCRELRHRCHRHLRLSRHARPSMGRATRKLSSTPTLVATPSGTPPQLPVLSATRCLCLHLHLRLASELPKTRVVATCEATTAAVAKSARQTGKRSTGEGIHAAEVRRVHPAHEAERRIYGELGAELGAFGPPPLPLVSSGRSRRSQLPRAAVARLSRASAVAGARSQSVHWRAPATPRRPYG